MEKPSKKKKKASSVKESLLTMFGGVVLAVILLQFVQPTLVSGESMVPTLKNGDYLLVNKMAYKNNNPQFGDIVVFRHDNVLYIKRVIGEPGDKIKISDGKVYRNDVLISDFTKSRTEPDMTIDVPEGEFFCLGDNRAHSHDSRSNDVGTVEKDIIMGKAVFRVFSKIGKVK